MKLLDTIRYKIKCTRDKYAWKHTLKNARQEIVRYYKEFPPAGNELGKAVDYLKNHDLCTFPAAFNEKYAGRQITVCREPSNGLPYVVHENKKLFFRRASRTETVKCSYRALMTEQDPESPHCYTDEQFGVEPGDVLFDVGSAEGIFALTHIEKLKKVVFFERDSDWVEALEATFEPYKDKVTIIPKYVSDKNDETNLTIDRFLAGYPDRPDFIKIDVEGAEASVLAGMRQRMESASLKVAVCTYHRADDLAHLSDILGQAGFKLTESAGYMLFLNEIPFLKPPYFRKGLIRAVK